jgi:hypothetical protein
MSYPRLFIANSVPIVQPLDSCSLLATCGDKLCRNDVIPVGTGIQEGKTLNNFSDL